MGPAGVGEDTVLAEEFFLLGPAGVGEYTTLAEEFGVQEHGRNPTAKLMHQFKRSSTPSL